MIFGKHINRYYLRYMPMFLLGLFALIMVDYFQLKIPEYYRMVINGMNGEPIWVNGEAVPFDLDFLLDQICMPLIVVVVTMTVGRFLWRICFLGSGVRLETSLRNTMFDHCKDLSRQYYQVNKVGDLMSLFTNDLDTVQECFGWGIMMLADALFLGGLAVYKMWQMDPVLAGLSMIPMAFLMAASIIVGKYLMDKWDIRQAAFSKLSDFSQESFSGIAVIKAFVKETKELWAFKKLNIENEKANVDYTKLSTLLRISVTLFVESVVCVILGYGGFLVWRGTLDVGQLMEFIGYFTSIVWPIMAVSELIDMTSRGKASLKRIEELLDAKRDVIDSEGATPLTNVNGKIEFRNLTFRHNLGEYDALKNVTFTINAGENVGIIGRTGAGKTTLVDLILRNYNVPAETLFIDDRDVNDITIRSLRDHVAYVPQDNFLFSDTIANNISFASDNSDLESVKRAAELAEVSDNIEEFSEKYETVLGERGFTVSGGQKQRISIARALMKKAPILILDDSLSAVDTKTERNLLQNLQKERGGKTTILIAHRISTIERMDKILFLEDGELAAVGSHGELYESCPAYRTMVDLQKLEEEGGIA